MRLRICAAQSFDRDVRVDLGARQGGVAEQLLHGSQVGAAVEQMGRGGVPERMR